MISLRNVPIRTKLIGMLLFVTIASLVAGFGVHIALDVAAFRQDLAEGSLATARVIGDYCVVDIVFDDPVEAERTLSKLASNPHLLSACLYDAHDRLFASYNSRGTDACPAIPQPNRIRFGEHVVSVIEPVQYQKRTYGKICLTVSTGQLEQQISEYLTTILLLTAGLILVSYLLALQLQRVISSPIQRLALTTREISESRDYSVRVQKTGEDEIGMLCDEFNSMLGQIQAGKEEQDRVERALRESEDRYRLLVESTPDAILLEQGGKIQYANPAALRLLGCEIACLSDASECEQPELTGCEIESFFQNLATTASKPQETTLQRMDGKRVDVEVTVIDTVFQGKPARQFLTRDITESRALRQRAERDKQLAALGEFSAVVAHEVRNSLGSITLNMRTLAERLEVPDSLRKTFANMELGTERIREIVNGILEYSRPAPPKLKKVYLHRILDNSIRALETQLEGESIRLIRNYDPSDPEVQVDPTQISQVFVNLLLNAVHALSRRPGGTITVTTGMHDSLVVARVADNGPGVPAENLERIFDPFYTTHRSGAGLGLAIVSRILEQHGATIQVTSKPEEGAEFIVRFQKVSS